MGIHIIHSLQGNKATFSAHGSRWESHIDVVGYTLDLPILIIRILLIVVTLMRYTPPPIQTLLLISREVFIEAFEVLIVINSGPKYGICSFLAVLYEKCIIQHLCRWLVRLQSGYEVSTGFAVKVNKY